MNRIEKCEVLTLPKIHFREGNITPVQNNKEVPFEVKRVFYIYDIPGGESRGAHAHRTCHQFLVAASGAFEVMLDDGNNRKKVSLNQPYFGLYIPPMIWASEVNFSSGSICLILASHLYDAGDYIRDFDQFVKEVRSEM